MAGAFSPAFSSAFDALAASNPGDAYPAPASSAWVANAPAVSAGGGAAANPAPATASWAAGIPSASGGATASPGPASAAWHANGPAASGGAVASPAPASAAWAANPPTVSAGGAAAASPASATASWSVAAPGASGGAAAGPGSASATWRANAVVASAVAATPPSATIDAATYLMLLGDGLAPPPAPPPPPYRDRDVYLVLKGLAEGTGEFDRVVIGRTPAGARIRPEDSAWLVIQPRGDQTREDGSPSREFHAALFALTFGVRGGDDPEEEYESRLDRLGAVLRNTLMAPGNRTFGGLCLGGETKLSEGSIQVYGWPGIARSINGRFGYSVSLASSSYSIAP